MEIDKINKAVSSLEERIAAGITNNNGGAFQQTAVVRTSAIGTAGSDTSMNGVNEVNSCDMSTCNDSVNVPNHSTRSCSDNVNTLSVVDPNGRNDLNELSLPKFSNSNKQVVAHFLRELDEYFSIRKTPNELKLPLCFRAIEDPFAKQWFATVYDTVGSYENFKTAFANLLWGQTRQAQIRCSIYQDHWDRRREETYAEHYIRYASMASMLNPPLSEEDLVGAMISHYPPEVQNGMVCGNLKTTQAALEFLSKMQGLAATRSQNTRPRREYDENDANSKPWRGRTGDAANGECKGNPQTRNARYVRSQRDRADARRQSPGHFGRNGEPSGWGRSRWQGRQSLDPRAHEFEPQTSDRGVANPAARGQDQGHGNTLNA